MTNLIEKTTLAKAIRDAKRAGEDVWLTDATKQRGVGALRFRARGSSGNGAFYFRYTDSSGKQDSLALGVYDPEGRAGLTLKQARAKYGEWSRLYQGGKRDLRALFEHQEAEERAHIEGAARKRDEAERLAKSGTLSALLDGYVKHLERQGKQAKGDARNIFRLHVKDAFPHLAAMRASEITHKDVSAMLAKLIDRGAGRTAGKLRSYLRAAFAAALQAESDPTVHPDLHGFNLTANPAAIVPAKMLARYNRTRERVLTASELHHFLAGLGKCSGPYADAIMLELLLGGQRAAQLLRVRPADVDMDAGTVTLFDRKGARQQPRVHVLPLTERAAEIVGQYVTLSVDDKPLPYLFTSTGKRNRTGPVHPDTLSELVKEICAGMMKEKTARTPFDHRDLRRTCETMLAAMGISKDYRAQIQSHGLGGVQDRHYDRHAYMDEKRRALEAWDAKLQEIASGKALTNVLPLRKGSRTAA